MGIAVPVLSFSQKQNPLLRTTGDEIVANHPEFPDSSKIPAQTLGGFGYWRIFVSTNPKGMGATGVSFGFR